MARMSNLVLLKSVADIVKAFGGTFALAEWAGVVPSAVSNWVAKDYIPPGWHYRMYRELVARGFDVDEAVFDDRLRSPRGVATVVRPVARAG